jgi:dolichol-phosphate mannosyltransferase
MTAESAPLDANSAVAPVELTIMIPAYREGANLVDLVPEIKASVSALTPNYEILVVDTQINLDETAEVCAANGIRHVNRYGGNQYGDAIRTGFAEARGEYVLCMDGDGSHSPSYFPAMWSKRGQYDIVIGSRYTHGGQTENPAILIWMSYIVNVTFRIVFRIHAKDVTNSFRLYRRSILGRFTLESGDFDILEELLIKAVMIKPPATITEVPVTFARRKAGESKRKLLPFALGYLKTLQKLRKFQSHAREELQAQSDRGVDKK